MQSNVLDLRGNVVRSIDLDDRVFGIEPNRAVVHQAVVTQEANARQGSKRAPHYTGGGIVFGPHPRSYEKAFPRKMRRLAMRSVLSARAAEQALTVVDAFTLEAGKTKSLLAALATLGAPEGAVIVLGERSDSVFRAARNLERVHVVTPNGLCLLDVLKLPRLILVESAIVELTRTLTADLAPPSAPVPAEPAPKARRARAAKTEDVAEVPSEDEETATKEADAE